jgi:hypothetical protein
MISLLEGGECHHFHTAGKLMFSYYPVVSEEGSILVLHDKFVDGVDVLSTSALGPQIPLSDSKYYSISCQTHDTMQSLKKTARARSRTKYTGTCEIMLDVYWQTLLADWKPLSHETHSDMFLRFHRAWAVFWYLHHPPLPAPVIRLFCRPLLNWLCFLW